MTVFVDPASAGVAPGQVFVHHEANGDGDGPMKTRAKFWEVIAVTPKPRSTDRLLKCRERC